MKAPDRSRAAADDEVTRLRVPPHSAEAEQSVLGGLLIDSEAWDRAGDLLSDGDFYRHEHRLIYAAIGALVTASKPADVVTVFEHLQQMGRAEDVGGLAYLNALAQSVPSAANLRRYAEIVRERSVLRQVIATADVMASAAFNAQGRSAADVLNEGASRLAELERGTVRQQPRKLSQLVLGRLDHVQDLADGAVQAGWPTGFDKFDELLLGGLKPGKVYVVAARPSVGKSSFALDLAIRLARQALPVLVLSQEMPDEEVADRAISSLGRIDGAALARGRLSDGQWSDLTEAVETAVNLPLWVDDQPALRLADIRAKARAVPNLKVLIVDYLQLMAGSGSKGDVTRNSEIEEITRGLKALAKSLGLAVIELSQLNRDVEKRGPTARPRLSDLRDSGGIEQDADVIAFLWKLRQHGDGRRLIGMAIEKHRGGPLGEFALDFLPHTHAWSVSEEGIPQAVSTSASRGFTE